MKDAAELEYIFNFITYGAYRVICIWLNKEQRESPREIARQLIRLIQMEQT
ncbi:MAG: TetR family transcriptional regulator C-terminal domain-containing protein [Clostridia bacterium]|nr:TetR family transcriptional regulator C-terminal domain-containing protein [Clostridia bacterium]